VAAAVVQSAVKDPNPGHTDVFDNGSGVTYQGHSQSVMFSSASTIGSTLLLFAVQARDTFNDVYSATDPVNGAYTQLGDLQNNTDCNCDIKAFVKFNALPILPVSWTGTGAVSSGGVLTIGSGTGAFRLGQRITSASTPARSSSGGDITVVSLLSGTLGVTGSTYQLSPDIFGTTFSSQTMTTGDFINIVRNEPPGGGSTSDYNGAWLAELSGTDWSTAYFSGNNNAPTAAGTDTVTSSSLTMAATPGILFGFGFNGGVNDSNPFPPLYAPTAGTGFTNSSAILQYDQGNPICTIEWQHFTSLGTRAATFSPTGDSRYATVAVGFLDAIVTGVTYLPKFADRVQETTTTSGTGTITLAGASAGFQSFATAFATNTQVAYRLLDGVAWEVGYGTFTTGFLSRDVITASSAAGAVISLSGGSTQVVCTASAAAITAAYQGSLLSMAQTFGAL
jgi:hypothetical protein